MAKKRSVKINRAIYITYELDNRMKKASDVNWSAVASTAFERELELRREIKNMEDVIARLKASSDLESSEEHDQGLLAGKEWATKYASAGELKRLARVMREDNSWVYFEENETSAYTCGEVLAFAILAIEGDRSDAEEFWDRAIGEELQEERQSGHFMKGFVDGALVVWESVKDRV